MLKKLLKYDIKTINKALIIFYSLSIFFAVLTRIFFMIDNSMIMNIIAHICSGATISMIFNILINNIIRLWVRFKANLYGDESYLTHTLPVTKNQLYLSKFIISITTLLISVVVILISLFIAYYSKENLQVVKNLLIPLATVYESTIIVVILQFVFICFLELMNMLQAGYTGIIIGHQRNNNKLGFSILFGFIVYLLTQIIAILGVFVVALFNDKLMNLFYTVDMVDIQTVKLCIAIAIAVYTLNIVILYVINQIQLKKGVNVE